jgi:hypothetical protein
VTSLGARAMSRRRAADSPEGIHRFRRSNSEQEGFEDSWRGSPLQDGYHQDERIDWTIAVRRLAKFSRKKLLVSGQVDFASCKYSTGLISVGYVRAKYSHAVALTLRVRRRMRILSWRRWRFGEIAFVVFIVTQALDGVLTYVGVRRFGTGIEANALIGWYTLSLGIGRALIGAKAFAVMCAAILYINKQHLAIGLLTVMYLAAAVWPWTRLLWQ